MRILVLDGDAALEAALAVLLEHAGYRAVRYAEQREIKPEHIVAMVLGLPAPSEVDPQALPDVPRLVLVGEAPWGEIERWLSTRAPWTLRFKPVREEELLASLARLVGEPPSRL